MSHQVTCLVFLFREFICNGILSINAISSHLFVMKPVALFCFITPCILTWQTSEKGKAVLHAAVFFLYFKGWYFISLPILNYVSFWGVHLNFVVFVCKRICKWKKCRGISDKLFSRVWVGEIGESCQLTWRYGKPALCLHSKPFETKCMK